MVNTNDPEGLDQRLPRQERLLDEAAIPEADRQSIKDYLVHLKANADVKKHTMAARIKDLRLTSKRADTPLTEMDQTDWNRFVVEELKERRDLAVGTINQYKAAARPYFQWADRDWYTEITFAEEDSDGPDPDELFTEEEIDAMLNHGDSRDKAAAALYADTGWRASAITSLRVKDIDLEGEVAVIQVNEDAHVKGAEGGTPLSFSRAYVASYLRGDHPCPDNPEAPLIHKKRDYEDGDRALSTGRIREAIKEMAEAAGIDRDRVKIHNFRHSAVTRWRRQGVPDHVIQKRAKWVEGTQMLDRYDNPDEDDEIEDMAVAMGLIERGDLGGTDAGEPGEDVAECPVCFTEVRRGARYCPGCANPLNADAAEGRPPEGVQDPEETAEDLADIDGVLDEMGTGAVLEQLLRNNPDLLDDLDLG